MSETRDMGQETAMTDAGPANLDAWRLSDDLAVEASHLSRSLPSDLRWLSSQIARSAPSVPANIAEGYSRSSKKEFLHFLSIARGSLTELEYYLHFLRRVELIDSERYGQLDDLRRRAGEPCSVSCGRCAATSLSETDPPGIPLASKGRSIPMMTTLSACPLSPVPCLDPQ